MKEIKFLNISTSETEIKDIIKAWIAISIAFGVALSGSILSVGFYAKFYTRFVISSLTVGVGFLLHEMGHKIVAQKYRYFAEFRSFDNMLILAIAMSFFGIVFAAPGAVMIEGRNDKKKNGKISAAGPIINLFLSLIFLALFFLVHGNLKSIAYYGFMINSWLALFNMIPFWLFDGYKILKWNKLVYGAIVGIAVIFMLAQNFVHLA